MTREYAFILIITIILEILVTSLDNYIGFTQWLQNKLYVGIVISDANIKIPKRIPNCVLYLTKILYKQKIETAGLLCGICCE